MDWPTLSATAYVAGLSSLIASGAHAAGTIEPDEIFRQNPTVFRIPGVPRELKVASTQRCPSGRTPDISRNQCVIAYASNIRSAPNEAYVFVLHLNSEKVWLVFKSSTRNEHPAQLLGALDYDGRRVNPLATVTDDGRTERQAVPASTPSVAARPQLSAQPQQRTQVAEDVTPRGARNASSSSAPGSVVTVDQPATSVPIPLVRKEGSWNPTGPYKVLGPWGTELQFSCLGISPVGQTIVPSSIDLTKSARSGKYLPATVPNDPLIDMLPRVEEQVIKSCQAIGRPISPTRYGPRVYLFTTALPESFGAGYAVVASRTSDEWNIENRPRDAFDREQAQTAAAAARQRADAERQLQEAERKRQAERAEQERLAQEKERQAKVAVARAEAEKKAADRDKARHQILERFVKKHDLMNKESKGLYANPFAFDGNRLLLAVAFEQMESVDTALFYLPKEGVVVVTDVPRGAFVTHLGKVLLAAKVVGNVRYDGVVENMLQVHGMVPKLKYLGALICQDQECYDMQEK